ncbi:hypothetical protein BDW62DRAFT_193476 [Aspergillus aurantiobrunneus]
MLEARCESRGSATQYNEYHASSTACAPHCHLLRSNHDGKQVARCVGCDQAQSVRGNVIWPASMGKHDVCIVICIGLWLGPLVYILRMHPGGDCSPRSTALYINTPTPQKAP